MTSPSMSGLLTHVLVLMLTLNAWTGLAHEGLPLDENVAMAEGRQASMDVDCTGYSFEDLFEYDFALFGLTVLDDWATGEMFATAWVNESNAAIVRDNLDGLFEGISDNGYISTDERDAIRSIGPSCIADMDTRLTMDEGAPHDGEGGTNRFQFVEEGIGLDEVNLVPLDHEGVRTCQTFGSTSGCKEVPTTATDNLEITLDVADGETNNVRWDQLPNSGASNFTLSMNITNMSNAALVVTFPALSGLRLVDFRIVDNAPTTGDNCDHIDDPSFTYLADGRLTITQLVNFDRTLWELECHMFMDFTTQAPLNNAAPEWTDAAPENGTVIGTTGAGTTLISTGTTASMWGEDEDGWQLMCEFDQPDWTVTSNVLGDLFVNQPTTSSVANGTCQLVDPLGAVDENDTRTWTFGTLFTATGNVADDGMGGTVELTGTGLMAAATVQLQAVQGQRTGALTETVSFNGGEAVNVTFTNSGFQPGVFTISVRAQATGMLPLSASLDLGLVKPNSLPVLVVQPNFYGENATWSDNLQRFTLSGTVSDADLEPVSLRLSLCGADYTDFTVDGINWAIDVSTAICVANALEVTQVTLTATDDSGGVTTLTASINAPDVEEPTGVPEPAPADEEDSLPFLSIHLVLACLGAALMLRQTDEE